jgi:hypothetical protein
MRLDNGLAGAILLELAITGRLDVQDERLVVLESILTGDPLLDRALEQIVTDGTTRKPAHWMREFAKNSRRDVLGSLVAAGVLDSKHVRVLGVFPRTRYPAPQGVEPVAETEARQRMVTAITTPGDDMSTRTAALCSLVAATGLERKVFPDLDRKLVEARLAEIGQGTWAAAAVKRAIKEIQTVVMVSVIAATTAAATSGG